ncbi:Hpt domain-containing protein [Neobittarella massiliensis]|uniref:Hpt domain-containing protein n=1 Tax=Neobittarella massiliensis (ex Bilen et al. 2018) TaxID=2041842 RepID=A0A8J6IPX7_9FIRM|nr:Hpt domain-containing protein [Neobittarella massiliensis]MBC3516775.1 Hpt domain-containing protein [Neobittarella massiliensis]
MTTEELYRQIGGDYADTLRRLGSSERIQRFLSLFLREDSCRALADALREGRAEDAFRVAHSLKGMCLNLGLRALGAAADTMTEALRGGRIPPAADALYAEVKRAYDQVEAGTALLDTPN